MNNFLLTLGALLVGILAALAIVPMVVDWNSYRGVFEEDASRMLGRDVRVGGAVNLRILPVPYVRFEKLRIADTASTGGDPLFRAESVTMRLSIAPLLRGVIEAQSVELKRPFLRLAVDQEGRSNWRTLALQPGSLPFLPADVALQSVGIEGGTLVLAGGTGADITQFDDIGGEFAAESVDGPFRFKGTANWAGVAEEVRLATSKPDGEGATRFKASVRTPSTLDTFAADGRVLDLKGHPRIEGDVTAKLAITRKRTPAAAPSTGTVEPDAFDFKSRVAADINGARLTDIALSLDTPADPQLITGAATLAWGVAPRLDLALATRSFNLDRFVVPSTVVDPLETARAGLAAVVGALPPVAETVATLKAERLMLGGEPVTGVTAIMSRRGADIEIKMLKAALPGATRLQASGTITHDAPLPGFAGSVSLRGGNLARFLAWSRRQSSAALAPSRPSDSPPGGRYDGAFSLEGQLTLTGARVEVTGAQAEFAGVPIAGELRYGTEGGRRRLGLVIEGERIDANQLWPGGFDAAALAALVTGAPGPAASGDGKDAIRQARFFGFDPETTDLDVAVRAGELQLTAATNIRAVDTAFTVDRGTITVPRLRFATQTGLTLDLDGDIGSTAAAATVLPAARGPRRGTVRWIATLPNPQAVEELAANLPWPASAMPDAALVAAVGRLGAIRLAGSSVLGGRGPDALDLTVDGAIDGGRIEGVVKLDHGIASWATAPLDARGSVETASVDRWMALIGVPAFPDTRGATASRSGVISFSTQGAARSGMTALVSLASDGLTASYRGHVTVPAAGAISLDGTADVAAGDVTHALALAGVSLGRGPSALGFAGSVGIVAEGTKLTLSTRDAKLGGIPFAGSVSLAAAQPNAIGRTVDGTLAFDAVTARGLLAALGDRSADHADDSAPWPSSPFKLAGGPHRRTRSHRKCRHSRRTDRAGSGGSRHRAVAWCRHSAAAVWHRGRRETDRHARARVRARRARGRSCPHWQLDADRRRPGRHCTWGGRHACGQRNAQRRRTQRQRADRLSRWQRRGDHRPRHD